MPKSGRQNVGAVASRSCPHVSVTCFSEGPLHARMVVVFRKWHTPMEHRSRPRKATAGAHSSGKASAPFCGPLRVGVCVMRPTDAT
jgi:hypothetical protein